MKIELRNLQYEDYFMQKDAMIEAYFKRLPDGELAIG